MNTLAKRNLKLYFRDRSAVIVSLITVVIIIGLYTFFLGDIWADSYTALTDARSFIDHWAMAGLLAVASVTSTLGAFSVMIEDKGKRRVNDFYTSPMPRRNVTGGYLMSTFLIGMIMSLAALVLVQVYLLLNGGELFKLAAVGKILCVMVVSTLANTAMMCFISSLIKSQGTFTMVNTIIGTLIGFITGVYLPVGELGAAVQWMIKLCPTTHAAALYRQILTDDMITDMMVGAPLEYVNEFRNHMGNTLQFGDYVMDWRGNLLVLVGAGAIFTILSAILSTHKNKSR